jgi:hypothetical protein
MKNACTKWKDQLLEAALGEPAPELEGHLAQCAECTAELVVLKARRERLDALLPMIARAEGPSPGLRARIIAAAEASTAHRQKVLWQRWIFAGVAAVIALAVFAGWAFQRSREVAESELRAAQALAEWRAPTDFLLRSPGDQWLNSTPKLGESYIKMPTESGDRRR